MLTQHSTSVAVRSGSTQSMPGNGCPTTNILLTMWELASVIPVYKKPPKSNPCNYRPVSLLPIFIEDYGSHREPSSCFLPGFPPSPSWQPEWVWSRPRHGWCSYCASARMNADGRKWRNCTHCCSRYCWGVWSPGSAVPRQPLLERL